MFFLVQPCAWFAGDNHPGRRNVDVANAPANKPQMYIAEAGWLRFSSTTAEKTDGASEASEPNHQIFLDTFVCTANT
jgi:hypothetical protein